MFDTDKLAPSQSTAVLAPHKSPLRGLGDSEVAPTPVGYSEAFMLGRDSERGSPVIVQDGQPFKPQGLRPNNEN
jgi:hypothetical protein